jgi:hypothetical protein
MLRNFVAKMPERLFNPTHMKFLFLTFLLPLQLFAQDISGVWTGTLYNDTTKQFIKYELAISEYNGKLSGYSHTIFVIDSFENIIVKSIKVKKSGEKFIVEDVKLIYNNYTEPPARRVKKYSDLSLSHNDTSMVLSGLWKTNITNEYKGLTGKVFLQKRKKIKETLIIAKLENLKLTGSLSFMASPTASKDLTIINKPVFNPGEPKKPVDIAKDVVSNTRVPVNTEIQQADRQNEADKQISEGVLNKESTAKEKTQIRGVQLPVEDKTIQKNETTGVIQSGKISTKSEIPQNSKQQKGDKQIPGEVLNNVDSAVNKGIIKEATSPLAEISIPKNKPSNIVAIKSEPQQTDKQHQADKQIPGMVLNKVDSAVNKDIIKEATSPLAEISTPKNKPSNIASIKSEVQQTDKQQQADKQIPGMVLGKVNSESTKPVKQVVFQPAAEIATRKIETIRSVDIKSDSLLLTLYDNGEIDGDTVSVLLNGKVIMPSQGLMSRAINKTIYLTPEMGDSIVLIMYAENLGSIPPNTGLLVVHDGNDIYEIRFSGDLQKNSAIILRRK